ncbi:MAG: phage tail tube protein [Baekduia sp.]
MAGITDALRRFGGMYGSAYRDNVQLAEAVEVTGNVEVNRIEVPLVGQTKTGYKPGRETREGTLNIQKIDMRWEIEIYRFLASSLAARRAARGTPQATLRTFDLKLEHDDPEAGYEAWQVENVQIWRLPLGISISDDITNREYPITWESERPLAGFIYNAAGVAVPFVP